MSLMARDAAETPEAARRQLETTADRIAELGAKLRATPPTAIITCARGSSDHAATYGKYVIETTLGRVVAPVGPSIASVYGRDLEAIAGALFIVVSQSGRSPDLLRLSASARARGAFVVGLINEQSAPLAASCDLVIPLCAGLERSVAATKSFLLAGLAFARLAAAWSNDQRLIDELARAPEAFASAGALAWSPLLAPLASASSLFVTGRGTGLGIAYELALKLKETAGIHAEGFSIAELRHGPIALVGPKFPVIALAQDDATRTTTLASIAELVRLGATVWSTLDVGGAIRLPTPADMPAVLAPLCHAMSFYVAAPELATARGVDADSPRHLRKVTETL
ncbi:MAG: SIS domain-containing protein [Kofleriaceae bacterium]